MQPVCLIRQGADGLEVVPEGMALLQSLELEPLAVICLAGQYRTGKSFFLNQLCRRVNDISPPESGFVVGPTTESCTRGIWIWDANLRNEAGHKIILMDTEGIASTDNDESYDAKIFSLGLLLSSLFVFNTMGVIDEGAIDRLFLVSELTKHVCIHRAQPTSMALDDEEELPDILSEADLAPHFPPFVWLLRDFLLDMQENGVPLTPNTYLERSLEPRDSTSRRMDERNRIRQSLRTLFARRECLTLVRPATDEDQLRQAGSLAANDLRPEFVAQMLSVRHRLLALAAPKRVLGQTMDGPKLSLLVQSYIATMNSGAVPDIKAAWEYVTDATCEAAAARALDEYHRVMATNTSMAQADFDAVYKDAQEAALGVYKKLAVDGDARKRCFLTLKAAIAADRAVQIAALQAKSMALCRDLLATLGADIVTAPIRAGAWDVEPTAQLTTRLAPLFEQYDAGALGPAKSKALLAFLQTDGMHLLDAFVARREAHHGAATLAQAAAALERERALEAAQRVLEAQVHALELDQIRSTSAAEKLQDQLATATAALEETRGANEALQVQLAAAVAREDAVRKEIEALHGTHTAVVLEKAQTTARLEQAAAALTSAQEERSRLEHEIADERRERTKEREAAIAEMATAAGELHAAQRALKAAATDHEALSRDHTVLAKEKAVVARKLELAAAELAAAHADIAAHGEKHTAVVAAAQLHQRRIERLETQLGDLTTTGQVALALEQCVWTVAKQADVDKAVQVVAEEKAALAAALGELHLKISSLPVFYQRQVFCAEEPTPDFFDALTAFVGS
ncbi:guanylate-binding protein [Achlya hypogyna]|uniref:Guanylate-binding protein n=1 Tax=Achlya hypogyna TaxID=1202772 RepID=A0A1V9Z9S5_ACHHY|nr:guanylate-binding protein [Achlya hypogyna]